MIAQVTEGRRAIQLPLGVGLRNGATLENFFIGPNEEAVGALALVCAGGGEQVTYLWGDSGTGKTHLLEALCHAVASQDQRVVLLPLRAAPDLQPEILTGLEQFSIVCIDDIDTIAGDRRWEQAAFHFYNRLEQWGGRLLVTGRAPPLKVPFGLEDLASRLTIGLTLQLRPLDDVARRTVVQQRARERGFVVPDDVAAFLLRRCRRDMHSLLRLVEQLDRYSLAEQRRITIPFARTLIDAGGSV